jgi:hypothetical protein
VERAKADKPGDVQAVIDELATHSAELSGLLHESVTALAELVKGRPATAHADGDAPAAVDPTPLAPDVLAIAALQARAAGLSIQEYLREAVLAYAARADDGPAAHRDARGRRARDEARRLRAETEALKAQTAETTARAAHVEERVRAARRRATGEQDGGPGS